MIYNLLRTMQFLREEVSKCFLLMFDPYSALPEGLCFARAPGHALSPTTDRLLPSAHREQTSSDNSSNLPVFPRGLVLDNVRLEDVVNHGYQRPVPPSAHATVHLDMSVPACCEIQVLSLHQSSLEQGNHRRAPVLYFLGLRSWSPRSPSMVDSTYCCFLQIPPYRPLQGVGSISSGP